MVGRRQPLRMGQDQGLAQDARRLKALANPVRLAILQYLGTTGPATATDCAAVAGLSPTACSYHLRLLAEHGFVVADESSDGRERPWRLASAPSMTLDPGRDGSDPELAAARLDLERAMEERDRAVIEQFYEHRSTEPDQWWQAAVAVQDVLPLSSEELERLGVALLAAIEPFRRPPPDASASPEEGQRWVYLSLRAVPWLAASALPIPRPKTGATPVPWASRDEISEQEKGGEQDDA